MKALHFSLRQRRRLEKQLKTVRDVRWYRRTLAVLEFERGRSVTEISRMLRVSRLSIYRWIERYREASDPNRYWMPNARDGLRLGPTNVPSGCKAS